MRRAATAFILIVGFAFVVMVAVGDAQDLGGNAEARKAKNPHASNAASIAAGKAAYMKACRFCHGEDAKGAAKTAPKNITPPSDLTDGKWERGSTDGELFAVIRHGAGPKFEMKANKVLKDDDVWHIVNYLRSLGPPTKK